VIILDTHAWIWLNGDTRRLSAAARETIRQENILGVSPISLWEVAMLWERGRVELDRSLEAWLEKACAQPKIRLLPITTAVAVRTANLIMHGDPADRIIVATALTYQCALVTVDGNIHDANIVKAVW